ncbi:unnamed protein product [Miscanthus lutarioriparius]|uniref:DUF6598 domain-containing protein n=1 Tax=Miscanthus lutarioriparius TaxID=422564 RepID=A0A811RUE3_9POAL|nr:unnamed protein product [Miscanthus lutarioriparius]
MGLVRCCERVWTARAWTWQVRSAGAEGGTGRSRSAQRVAGGASRVGDAGVLPSSPRLQGFKIRLDLIAFCEMATMLGCDGKGSMRKTMTKKPMISKASDEKSEEDNKEIVSYRCHWERCFGKCSGSFEDTTVVPPMRYTFGPIPKSATVEEGLQIFSVKVSEPKEEEGVHWPLHVFGLIAIRDSMDPRRNFIFHRSRDNCLTITEEAI